MHSFLPGPIIGWQFLAANAAYRRFDGVKGHEAAALQLYAPEAYAGLHADIAKVMHTSLPLQGAYPLLQGQGVTTLVPIADATGAVSGVAASLVLTPQAPEGSTQLLPGIFAKMVQAIPIDLVVFDVDHRFLFVSEQTVKDPELRTWMIGKTELEYCRLHNIADEVAHRRRAAFDTCLKQHQVVQYEETLHHNNQVINKIRSFQPVYDDQGAVQFVMGFGHDVTGVRESEHIIQRQHLAIESAIDGIALLDKEGRYYYLNQAHAHIFGYASPSELVGKSWRHLYSAEEVARIETEIFPLLSANRQWSGETTGVGKDGKPLSQEINLTLLPDGEMVCICRDVSQVRRQADELRKLALVVENTSSGVIITNQKQEIEWVNKGYTKITGYTLDEVLGKNPSLCQGPGTDRRTLDYIREQILKGEPFESELLNYTKDGIPYWIRIKGQPLYDAQGQVVKFFAIQEDITERKRMEEDLIVAKEAAEASARSKRRFLANMSHEIRTPMNAVMGLTAQLLKTTLNDTQRFYAETIESAAHNLLTIINDILDISKIEEGKLQIENTEMSLREVLQRMRNVLEHKAQEKGISLTVDVPSSLPEKVMGDPYRLNQVLLNVVGNALKFTEQGSVRVSCTTRGVEAGRHAIELVVEDTGIGMTAETLQHVFEEFFSQGDTSFVRKFGGTGLGLPISKSLVELMEGNLEISSAPGKGTRVCICIPFAMPEQHLLEPEVNETPDLSRLKHAKVLLVEDNKFNSLVAKLMLRNAGVDITLAENGEEAVNAVGKQEFDIILMDIQMPVMDGVAATRIIRQQLFCDTPIIALTAHALREEKESYLTSGMNDFLSKPFQEHDLLLLLHKWIRKNTFMYV